MRPPSFPLLTAIAIGAAGCSSAPLGDGTGSARAVAPPLEDVQDAYAFAGEVNLPLAEAGEYRGLRNVFHLSDTIVSGSEPQGGEAFETLAGWGVRTLVSVDGKAPDAALAERYGMRYVHLPIRYRGITEGELARLSKTYRELEGPFYVHCFHGKHRGPAAAAVGRLVADGASREQVVAEMRQYCGTSSSYDGLYRTLATAAIPDAEATRALDWGFPSAAPVPGMRDAMVTIARSFEVLELAAERGFAPDPGHPDVDPGNEARILSQAFAAAAASAAEAGEPTDLRGWMQDSAREASALADALARSTGGPSPEDRRQALARAGDVLERIGASCVQCHGPYRNR